MDNKDHRILFKEIDFIPNSCVSMNIYLTSKLAINVRVNELTIINTDVFVVVKCPLILSDVIFEDIVESGHGWKEA